MREAGHCQLGEQPEITVGNEEMNAQTGNTATRTQILARSQNPTCFHSP